MNQQDLVWVRLPFSDFSESKVRPALIVSNNKYNRNSKDVVVCAVTSNLAQSEYSVIIDAKNLSSGTLPLKSAIKADKILQIEKQLAIRPFGKLDDKTFDSVTRKLSDLVKRA